MVISKKQNLIKESEKEIENLIKTLESGEDADAISSQIEKKQVETQNLEVKLAKEKI